MKKENLSTDRSESEGLLETRVINFLPDDERHKEIKELERMGWRLCVGCINYSGESLDCITCPIEVRKTMGLPPEDRQKHL